MDSFVKDHLEDYLAGRLTGEKLRNFEKRLEHDDSAAVELQQFEDTAELFAAIRLDEEADPAPGFYYRVAARIEEEQEEPFWMAFLQPFMVRRLAFAALMWLFVLGSVSVFHDESTARSTQLADMILEQQPPSDQFYVRMGPDLDQNRASMLAVMLNPTE